MPNPGLAYTGETSTSVTEIPTIDTSSLDLGRAVDTAIHISNRRAFAPERDVDIEKQSFDSAVRAYVRVNVEEPPKVVHGKSYLIESPTVGSSALIPMGLQKVEDICALAPSHAFDKAGTASQWRVAATTEILGQDVRINEKRVGIGITDEDHDGPWLKINRSSKSLVTVSICKIGRNNSGKALVEAGQVSVETGKTEYLPLGRQNYGKGEPQEMWLEVVNRSDGAGLEVKRLTTEQMEMNRLYRLLERAAENVSDDDEIDQFPAELVSRIGRLLYNRTGKETAKREFGITVEKLDSTKVKSFFSTKPFIMDGVPPVTLAVLMNQADPTDIRFFNGAALEQQNRCFRYKTQDISLEEGSREYGAHTVVVGSPRERETSVLFVAGYYKTTKGLIKRLARDLYGKDI